MVERCTDPQIIKKIMTHPKVFDWLTDDNAPANFEPTIHPQVIYMVDEKKTGVIRIDMINSIMCSVHIATLPEMWGKTSIFALDTIAWGFKNTQYMKAIAIIPEYNDRVINLAKRVGFVQEGLMKKSFLKRWKLHDQVVLGLCKGDFLCQQQ